VVTVSGPCTVYVPAKGGRPSSIPTWLGKSWKDSGLTCESLLKKTTKWKLFMKEIKAAGDVILPAHISSSKGHAACYVFVGSGKSITKNYRFVASLKPNTTSYTTPALIPGREYLYRVRTANVIGKSDWSNELKVVLPKQ